LTKAGADRKLSSRRVDCRRLLVQIKVSQKL
jgi:hypothetical protein